jgi:hypothetical protein
VVVVMVVKVVVSGAGSGQDGSEGKADLGLFSAGVFPLCLWVKWNGVGMGDSGCRGVGLSVIGRTMRGTLSSVLRREISARVIELGRAGEGMRWWSRVKVERRRGAWIYLSLTDHTASRR